MLLIRRDFVYWGLSLVKVVHVVFYIMNSWVLPNAHRSGRVVNNHWFVFSTVLWIVVFFCGYSVDVIIVVCLLSSDCIYSFIHLVSVVLYFMVNNALMLASLCSLCAGITLRVLMMFVYLIGLGFVHVHFVTCGCCFSWVWYYILIVDYVVFWVCRLAYFNYVFLCGVIVLLCVVVLYVFVRVTRLVSGCKGDSSKICV
eukprot:gene3460-2411_t